MKRGKSIIIVAGCIMNANAKILPLAPYPGVNLKFIMEWIEKGVGILQLPCPETSFLGMKRWGMTKEQYDTKSFREHSLKIIKPALLEISAYMEAGYSFCGIAGIKGSPSCGIFNTCYGYEGGEISSCDFKSDSLKAYLGEGRGVFMDIVIEEVKKIVPDIELIEVDEEKIC